MNRFTSSVAIALLSVLVNACSSSGTHSGSNSAQGGSISTVPPVTALTASRTEGVAPLSVFFESPDQENGAPYLDATTTWDFDSWDFATNSPKPDVPDLLDSNNGRRYASGFLAAHVFEKPGRYRVSAKRYDAQGVTELGKMDITVLRLDEDTAHPWTTIYVALDGDTNPSDTGTGSDYKSPLKTTLKNTIENLAKAYTRVRIRKPANGTDIYKFETGVASYSPGPVIVDSYDPTALDNFYNDVPGSKKDDPNDPSTSDDTNAPNLQNQDVNGSWGSIGIGEDWRLMNLKITARGTKSTSDERYPGGPYFAGNNALIYRVEHSNMHGFWGGPSGHYNTVAECKYHDLSGTAYVGSDNPAENTHGAVIGNWVYSMTADDLQHVFRIQSAQKYFFAFNEFGPGTKANYDALTIRGNTERVVVYRNISHDYLTAIWPQGRNSYDEKQRYVVLESNLLMGGEVRNAGIGIHANDIVIRNNILVNFDLGVGIEDDTVVGPSKNIKVYNNTFIGNDAGSDFAALKTMDGCTFEAYNNIMWAGAKTSPSFLFEILQRTSDSEYWKNDRSSDYNLFFGTAAAWNGQGPNLFPNGTLAQWQSAYGLDTHSTIENPNLISVNLPDATDPLTPLVPAEGFAKPKADANAHVSQCKDLPGVALDFNGRLRSHPTQCGAVGFTPDAPATSP
jgi:hypothetical protein